MELKDRLEQLMKSQGLSQYKFADEIGMVRESFYKIVRGQTMNPGYEFFKSIKKRFPEVSYSWLLDGSGEMIGEESFTHAQAGSDAMPSESAEGWKAYAGEKDRVIERLEEHIKEKNDDIAFLREIIRDSKKSFSKAKFNSQAWMQLGHVKKEVKIISMTPSVSPLQVANM